jgi:hypothetical protein
MGERLFLRLDDDPLHGPESSVPAGTLRACAPSMGAILEVQVLPRADHSERSEAQLREGDRAWEGSVERKP